MDFFVVKMGRSRFSHDDQHLQKRRTVREMGQCDTSRNKTYEQIGQAMSVTHVTLDLGERRTFF